MNEKKKEEEEEEGEEEKEKKELQYRRCQDWAEVEKGTSEGRGDITV